ncbi:MAG: hypothetical protein IKZ89_05500 [Bacteroidaceae bacterium]|nr:hypothetical protein [Bacteroidaceae bacterium]
MKTRTSLAFDAMTGTAGEVTARSTRFGTILSGRARQPGKVTPQQKDMRALFARVGRSFKRLSPAQIDAWSAFAQQYSFSSRMEAKSPAVNAYVTLNCNRALLGLDMLKQPPTQMPTIPAVEYRNIIVTPGLIQFSRLVNPGTGYRLAVRMSAATSTGITQGAGLPVLVDAGFIPEQTHADITTVYIDRLTVRPTVGLKYFIETSWMDVATGLSGPRHQDDRICQNNL